MIKKLAIIILSIYLSSCAVLHEEYFFPEAEGARVEKESCRGKVGVDNQLVYSLENVEAEFHVWMYKGVTRLGIAFKVFEGGEVVWPDQVVTLQADSVKRELKADSFVRLRYANRTQSNELLRKEYPVASVMDRSTDEELEIYSNSFVILDSEISWLKIDEIRLIVNDKEYVLSDILFTKKSGLFIHPFNC